MVKFKATNILFNDVSHSLNIQTSELRDVSKRISTFPFLIKTIPVSVINGNPFMSASNRNGKFLTS